jgi:hypothetical protein
VTTKWAGSARLVGAGPAGSCESAFLVAHPDLMAQSAEGELQILPTGATLLLTTSGGQTCALGGSRNAATGGLTLESEHATCDGFPMSYSARRALFDACQSFDLAGDGPLWGSGGFDAEQTDVALRGDWHYLAYDPGHKAWTIELHLDLARR